MSQSAVEHAISALTLQTKWQRLAEIGLILLIFFVFGGDPAPHVNEPHYLCRFKHFWEPEWAAGDLFLESPDAHFFVVFSLGWMSKLISLTAMAWTLRIGVWIALAWAWQRLSFRLVPQAWCAPLAAAIWTFAIEQGNLAGEWVIGGFESKCVAYVFVLLALREIVDDRWNRAWMLLGCASAFHVLVGGWSVIVGLIVWAMLRLGQRSTPRSFVAMLPGMAIGGLISLLGLIPVLTLNRGTPPEVVAEAHYIYTFVRLPHHLALLHQSGDWILERTTRHEVVLFTWILLALRYRFLSKQSMAAPLGRMIYFALGALGLAICGMLLEMALRNHPYVAAKWQRFYWYRLNDVIGAAVAAWLVVDWIAELVSKRKAWGLALLLVMVSVVGARMVYLTQQRMIAPIAPADRKVTNYPEWVEMCEWVEAHTPSSARFFVPRQSHSFKWRTGRSEVVTWKDMPQDAASMVEWRTRIKDVFRPRLDASSKWLASPDLQLISELTHRYDADFVVLDTPESLNLPMVYPPRHTEHRTYSVYDLRPLKKQSPNAGSN